MYDEEFFTTIREGIQRSAEALVPVLLDVYRPGTVVDVGCGEGWWGREFHRQCDATVIGLDGHPRNTVIDVADHDLEQPMGRLDRFDLALCLEVAEHLSPGRAGSFMSELCRLADVVVFSAAIPGQGGTGHLNEQWPAYWVQLFEANGFVVTGNLRYRIWQDDRIENWYRQNLLIACHADHDLASDELFDDRPVLPLVHPVLYDARRAR